MTNIKKLLPNDWRWMRLGDVIAIAQPGFASGQRDPKGVIQLRMNNVDTRGNFVWDQFLRVPADQKTIERYNLKPGDIVFNNTIVRSWWGNQHCSWSMASQLFTAIISRACA